MTYKILKTFICGYCRYQTNNAYKDDLLICEACGNQLREIKQQTNAEKQSK